MAKNKTELENSTDTTKLKCGIIMPIAESSDYPKEHWKDVLTILTEAIEETQFESRLVSDDVAIGLIHDRIVTNIYNDDIIVCDVSSKNPNVMFELGLRLAFDKPTIIIKDEKTGYSFDTGVIEHLSYPSSLRFGQIVDFKQELIKKIEATYDKSKKESNYSPFLKSFGKTIVPASIQQTEIPEGKYILEQIESLRYEMRALRSRDINDSRNVKNFRVNENLNKEVFYGLLDKVRANNNKINEKDLFNLLRNESRNAGIDISLSELQNMINEYLLTKK
ncbi:hypothetical protein SAMN05661096_02014 [Marivirga sericea]|uniref:RNA helicase n=1 Tax=Marivirga sericea TaxID=1028 RepID=A0A1X7JRB6_9BACT|nr:hypothetical protein [Marivirga sericea]SMG30850.1 hypothetical protein SAMN05661096_02014 [Marivirga sericea]